MMPSTIYNKTTGEIVQVLGISNIPDTDTTSSIEGYYPGTGYYIDVVTKQPVKIPMPPVDGRPYTWDNVTKTWQLQVEQ